MKTENYPVLLQGAEEKSNLAQTLKEWNETCKQCNPLTPIQCTTGCKIWKQKNEFRNLYEKMKNPGFMTNLLNTLKNNRRLQILEMISKGRYSLARLQQGLKKLGYYHSQQTIAEEYVAPLIEVGLVEENQNQYCITLFGCRLSELTTDFHNIEDYLPSHSECYEETVLSALLNKPKTYEDLEDIIQAKSVSRVLNRLQKAKFVEAPKKNDYVFYFKTKRNSNNSKFSPTENRIYENIPFDGISAQELAEKANISLRRTYKYLRRLKGKKLVFTKKRPKSYTLTAQGLEIATLLNRIRDLVVEASAASS